jgi:tRNA (guanine-N7-)-methyltransferase
MKAVTDYSAYLAQVAERQEQLKFKLKSWKDSLRGRPCTLEFGSGHGHFLTHYAAHAPEKAFLGIDLLGSRLARARKKAERMGLENVEFIQAEATELLEAMPSDIFFEQAFMLFPDPWPKRRHHKNRMIQEEWLNRLADRMQPGGLFYFRTDDAAFADWTQAHLNAHTRWDCQANKTWPFEFTTVFQLKADRYFSIAASAKA